MTSVVSFLRKPCHSHVQELWLTRRVLLKGCDSSTMSKSCDPSVVFFQGIMTYDIWYPFYHTLFQILTMSIPSTSIPSYIIRPMPIPYLEFLALPPGQCCTNDTSLKKRKLKITLISLFYYKLIKWITDEQTTRLGAPFPIQITWYIF